MQPVSLGAPALDIAHTHFSTWVPPVWRSTPSLHGSIQSRQLVRFNFCWRALNRWPILEKGPSASLRAPVGRSAPTQTNRRRIPALTKTAPPRPVPGRRTEYLISLCLPWCKPQEASVHAQPRRRITRLPLLVSYHILRIELRSLLAQRGTGRGGWGGGPGASLACLLLVLHWCWGQLPIDRLPGTAPVTDGLWPRSF